MNVVCTHTFTINVTACTATTADVNPNRNSINKLQLLYIIVYYMVDKIIKNARPNITKFNYNIKHFGNYQYILLLI